MGTPKEIMSLAMDRPTLHDIENTILFLKESGGLLRTVNGCRSDDDGDMTLIGHVMATLPVNILISKFIVLGYCFGVLNECIIIGEIDFCEKIENRKIENQKISGAGLTTKSIFQQGLRNVVKFYSKKLTWADGSGSDLIAILNAYTAYDSVKKHIDIKKWADRYYLNEKSLSEMGDLIAEITTRLERFGITEHVDNTTWSSAEKLLILKVVIAGAFYPNYFVRSPSESDSREASRTLSGRDPSNTIYFSGFASKYFRQLYVQSIKKLLAPCTNSPENIQVSFDDGNEKTYVSFKQTKNSVEANTDSDLQLVETAPGQVCIEVYKALKLKKNPKPLVVRVVQ